MSNIKTRKDQRFRIEKLFQDLKRSGFEIEPTKIYLFEKTIFSVLLSIPLSAVVGKLKRRETS